MFDYTLEIENSLLVKFGKERDEMTGYTFN
jgi:hypothetical protein